MISLLQALQTAFTNNPTFAAFSGGLEYAEAADASTLPNLIVVDTSGIPNNYSTANENGAYGYVETAHMHFTVRSGNMTQVATTLEAIAQLLDHKSMNLGSNDLLIDTRVSQRGKITRDDEKVWRGDVEYVFTVSRTLH